MFVPDKHSVGYIKVTLTKGRLVYWFVLRMQYEFILSQVPFKLAAISASVTSLVTSARLVLGTWV